MKLRARKKWKRLLIAAGLYGGAKRAELLAAARWWQSAVRT